VGVFVLQQSLAPNTAALVPILVQTLVLVRLGAARCNDFGPRIVDLTTNAVARSAVQPTRENS